MTQAAELPALYVWIGGRSLGQDAIQSIESVVIGQSLCSPSYCELRFVQQQFLPFGNIRQGDSVIIAVDNKSNRLFEGDITAAEHQYAAGGDQKLVIRAYDLLHRLRKRQEIRQFANTKLSSLVADVVRNINAKVAWHGSNKPITQSYQWRQSDLAMITENCQRYGHHFFLWDNKLHVFPLSSGFKPKGRRKRLRWMKNLVGANVELNA